MIVDAMLGKVQCQLRVLRQTRFHTINGERLARLINPLRPTVRCPASAQELQVARNVHRLSP